MAHAIDDEQRPNLAGPNAVLLATTFPLLDVQRSRKGVLREALDSAEGGLTLARGEVLKVAIGAGLERIVPHGFKRSRYA